VNAKKNRDRYNESLWDKIDLEPPGTIVTQSDTMITMATTRQYEPTGHKKFLDRFHQSDTIQYLLVVKLSGRWKLYRMNSLEESFQYLKKDKDIVFYVEGMGKTFTTNLYRAAGLATQYNVNVVIFDYPSADPRKSKIRNFYFSKNNSLQATPLYLRFLLTIQKEQEQHKSWITGHHITLFHHSMGNRMVKRLAVEHMTDSLNDLKISRLILNAACVEEKKHAEWLSKLTFASQVWINYNRADLHLKAAQLLTHRRQLGRTPNQTERPSLYYKDLHPYMGSRHSLFLNRPDGYLIPTPLHTYYNNLFHGK
jgi:hypothetical protein